MTKDELSDLNFIKSQVGYPYFLMNFLVNLLVNFYFSPKLTPNDFGITISL